jgi:hypothetical protein
MRRQLGLPTMSGVVRIPPLCLVLICAVLALPTAAPGALGIGVVDDSPKGTLDGGEAF